MNGCLLQRDRPPQSRVAPQPDQGRPDRGRGSRAKLLGGFGDGIVTSLATEFVQAYMDLTADKGL